MLDLQPRREIARAAAATTSPTSETTASIDSRPRQAPRPRPRAPAPRAPGPSPDSRDRPRAHCSGRRPRRGRGLPGTGSSRSPACIRASAAFMAISGLASRLRTPRQLSRHSPIMASINPLNSASRIAACVLCCVVMTSISSSVCVTAATMGVNGALHSVVQSWAAMTGPVPWPSLATSWSIAEWASETCWVAALTLLASAVRHSRTGDEARQLALQRCWSRRGARRRASPAPASGTGPSRAPAGAPNIAAHRRTASARRRP